MDGPCSALGNGCLFVVAVLVVVAHCLYRQKGSDIRFRGSAMRRTDRASLSSGSLPRDWSSTSCTAICPADKLSRRSRLLLNMLQDDSPSLAALNPPVLDLLPPSSIMSLFLRRSALPSGLRAFTSSASVASSSSSSVPASSEAPKAVAERPEGSVVQAGVVSGAPGEFSQCQVDSSLAGELCTALNSLAQVRAEDWSLLGSSRCC